ncbi:MAG: alpha-1,6-mannosyltransferase [Hyphomicrobiaceae bacterium]|jgi:alpha-1,6-mannosyltransferase
MSVEMTSSSSSLRCMPAPSAALIAAWLAICVALAGFAIALLLFGEQFAWHRRLKDIPALWLAGGLFAAGLVYALIVPLIHWTLRSGPASRRIALCLVLLTGLVLRLMMIQATPALEDDFYRYLWDGAVTAEGHNPYALAPARARASDAPPGVQQLAKQGALVLERVNHPQLKTIYPPVSMAAFALAYWIEPWSLRAWRLVCLLGECLSVALILLLLGRLGRSQLWAALYWLNPLVIKELMNSGHMEAIVLPFVLGALLLLVQRRPVLASVSIGLAIGAKLWPVMLLPLILRPLLAKPKRLLAALSLLALMAVAWALPPWLGGLGSDSGFVAYATYWQTNSALFQSLQNAARLLASSFDVARETPGMVVRLAAAATVAGFAIWLVRDDRDEPNTIVQRAGLIVLALFLLSPAQFPWYACWLLIFAPLVPLGVHVGITVFLPLYYVSFYLIGIGDHDRFNPWLVWLEWLPIWAFLLCDAWRAWRQPLAVDLGAGKGCQI